MSNTKPKVTLSCPECGQDFDIYETPQKGQNLTCPNCWAALEVISIDPLILQWETVEDDPFPD